MIPWFSIAVASGFVAYTIWNQSYWWRALEENRFGWLTPAFVAFVLWDRRREIGRAWAACVAPQGRRVGGRVGKVASSLMGCLLGFGLMAFLSGALYRAGAGPSLKGTAILSLGVAAVLLSLAWHAAPRSPASVSCALRDDARTKLCLLLFFPSVVWLLSSPLVTVIEGYAILDLLRPIVSSVSFIFEMLGLPIGHEGNILVMPDHGRVGVEEACSGIRSITGCLFAGGFLSAIFLTQWWQKLILIGSAVGFALVMNWLRALFLAVWAYRYGTISMEKTVHDPAGYATLFLTAAALFGLASLLGRLKPRPIL